MTNNKSTPESLSPLNPLKGTFNRSLIFNDLSAYGGLGVEKLKINDLRLFGADSIIIPLMNGGLNQNNYLPEYKDYGES